MYEETMKTTGLRVNKAQMRTRCSVERLAQLTVSIKASGLDETQPILVVGDHAGASVISGHRRWLSYMLTSLLSEASVAEARDVIVARLPCKDGWVHLDGEVYYELAREVDIDIPVLVVDIGATDEILTLLRAGSGAEDPDLMGLSNAFAVALEAGITEARLAANVGMAIGRVRAIIALRGLPGAIADLVQDGHLGLGVCEPLLKMGAPKVEALVEAIEEKVAGGQCPTTKCVKTAAKALRDFQGPQVELEHTPMQRNAVRALQVIWQDAVRKDAVGAWAVAAKQALGWQREGIPNYGPWMIRLDDSEERLFTRERQYGADEFDLGKLAKLLPDVTCGTCVLAALPDEKRLIKDLELLCGKVGGCLHWIGEGDRFYVEVPWRWPAKERVAQTLEELVGHWEDAKAMYRSRGEEVAGKAIEIQRAAIRQFMETCETNKFSHSHPWATVCSRCRWKLGESPTKNPDVPHCQWADRRRRLSFQVRMPVSGSVLRIPLCHQYGPANDDWRETVPASLAPLAFPRDVMLAVLTVMEREGHSAGRGFLEFMVGRPLRSKDTPRRWAELLTQRIGDLSDAQLQTVFEWATCEWYRCEKGWGAVEYPIPRQHGGYAFYKEAEYA